MASPKVFVSSTCFDLSEIREQLFRFIELFGFEAVLSENGDVFYHPDLHTHESCVHEIANCQLFILIIGGRFGGEYIADKTKSITNAEYIAAKEKGIPIFTYVRNGVLSNHHIYMQNKKKEFVKNIDYPAIDKQEHAIDIFNFIDIVRKSPTNNAFEGFNNFQDIDIHLRKQWAGMFFELLKSREIKAQIDTTNQLISGISSTSSKLEELVKSLYLSSNKDEAIVEIESIETYSLTERFFDDVLFPSWQDNKIFQLNSKKINPEKMAKISPNNMKWYEYLVKIKMFTTESYPDEYDNYTDYINCIIVDNGSHTFSLGIADEESKIRNKLYENGVKNSTVKQREKVITRMLKKYGK